jgi:hypothetical protein
MRLTLLLLALSLFFTPPARSQTPPEADRVRLAEAFRLADAVQDEVWPGWSAAPFAVLLVTAEHEFLVRHPAPSEDFTPLGYDSLLASEVHVRPRQFPPTFLATFPAVGGVQTVVVGQAEATGKSSTLWVVTLLHEHFHQLQYTRPGYLEGVAALDLAGGDETGMWMLNYPFPYDSTAVVTRFSAYRDALRGALAAVGTPDFAARTAALGEARAQLWAAVSERDRRYLAFQFWQEGAARYTEHRVAEAASRGYAPLPAFQALPDFAPYAAAVDSLDHLLQGELDALDLATWERVVVYPVGAAEALVLDAASPGWQRRYFAEPFALDRY